MFSKKKKQKEPKNKDTNGVQQSVPSGKKIVVHTMPGKTNG